MKKIVSGGSSRQDKGCATLEMAQLLARWFGFGFASRKKGLVTKSKEYNPNTTVLIF
jgi:hypothetical protein